MLDPAVIRMIGMGILETFYMTLVSAFFAYLIGLPMGVILVASEPGGISPKPALNKVLGLVINILRSIPFIILLLAMIPVTRFIVGSIIGPTAIIPPLVTAAAPFVARMVESSLKEVDPGVVEAAQSMGASSWQIIWKVLLPEARPSLVTGSAIAVTTILGYTAMAGFVGGRGLGDIAIRYGFYRYEGEMMSVTVVLLVVIVQIFQEAGTRLARLGDKRIR